MARQPSRPSQPAAKAASVDLSEIGVSGLKVAHGRVLEEQLRQLQGDRAVKVWQEMRDNDAVVASVLLAFEVWVREAGWRTEPASPDRADAELSDLIDGAVGDMSSAWEDFVTEALTMLQFGWSFAEICYKRRQGFQRTKPSSDFGDGKVGWRKVAFRAQDSRVRWEFDEAGGLAGMWQRTSGGGEVLIPVEKSLLFRTSRHKDNPEPKPLLRPAFVPWFYRKHLREVEAIGVERDLAGFPVLYVDREILANAQRKAEYEKIARDIKRDEQEGLVMPAAFDEHGNRRVELQLLASGGARQFDVGSIMARYALEITQALLADVVMLGHEKVGSFALAETKMDLLEAAGETWLAEIAQVFNTHAVPRLLELNGLDPRRAPKRVPGEIRAADLKDRAAAIKDLALGGFLTPDDGVEDVLRDELGLPERDVPSAPPVGKVHGNGRVSSDVAAAMDVLGSWAAS